MNTNKNPEKNLELTCCSCNTSLFFSLSDLEKESCLVCPECQQKFLFADETLKNHLLLFNDLCAQIKKSKEILGMTSVTVDVGPHSVDLPFKLLLTRLKSLIDLQIGDKKMRIAYRVDTTK